MAETAEDAPLPRSLPSLTDAMSWSGYRVDEIGGSSVARVQCIFVDRESREPAWVIAKVGRFGKVVAIPFLDCAPAAGHVWVPHSRDTIRSAPGIDPSNPLTREQELVVCEHYGLHDGIGRARDVKGRPEGAITSQAAAGAA